MTGITISMINKRDMVVGDLINGKITLFNVL